MKRQLRSDMFYQFSLKLAKVQHARNCRSTGKAGLKSKPDVTQGYIVLGKLPEDNNIVLQYCKPAWSQCLGERCFAAQI